MTAIFVYDLWQLTGICCSVAISALTLGVLIGKRRGYQDALRLLRPDLAKN
jgi:hypothetical protein